MNYSLVLILVIVVLLVGRRIMRGTRGANYSVQSIFLRPIIYLVLSLVLVLGLELWQIGVVAAAVIIGVLLGRLFGRQSNIFEKNGRVMYTRSNVVLGIWIVAFVIRIAIDFFADPALMASINGSSSGTSISAILAAGQTNPILFFADILLALSAGLLLGEALVLYETFNAKFKT